MGCPSWPSADELVEVRKTVSEMAGGDAGEVRVVVSPYRICPLGAHIDHQGGTVSAMTINKGILLGFIPSGNPQVLLHSSQFQGEVKFRIDEMGQPLRTNGYHSSGLLNIHEDPSWGNYARGAVYALQRSGKNVTQGIIGFICASGELDSSGLSSSAAVGVAYLLALECTNKLEIPPIENIELDRLIENEYLGLRNGILDQSAILLSRSGHLTIMNCKTKEYVLVDSTKLNPGGAYKILLAFSGLRHCLTNKPEFNNRVSECREAARILLHATGKEGLEPILCNVGKDVYEAHKGILETSVARRAEHYFTESTRVTEGLKAWASGNLVEFGRLISASGLSSIQNYECGCEPLIQLYEILLKAPGVFGARFSGAGFRGCCVAFVDAHLTAEAATFVKNEYRKVQPKLANQLSQDTAVIICEAGDRAHIV